MNFPSKFLVLCDFDVDYCYMYMKFMSREKLFVAIHNHVYLAYNLKGLPLKKYSVAKYMKTCTSLILHHFCLWIKESL